jgi:hypothetical protein
MPENQELGGELAAAEAVIEIQLQRIAELESGELASKSAYHELAVAVLEYAATLRGARARGWHSTRDSREAMLRKAHAAVAQLAPTLQTCAMSSYDLVAGQRIRELEDLLREVAAAALDYCDHDQGVAKWAGLREKAQAALAKLPATPHTDSKSSIEA